MSSLSPRLVLLTLRQERDIYRNKPSKRTLATAEPLPARKRLRARLSYKYFAPDGAMNRAHRQRQRLQEKDGADKLSESLRINDSRATARWRSGLRLFMVFRAAVLGRLLSDDERLCFDDGTTIDCNQARRRIDVERYGALQPAG